MSPSIYYFAYGSNMDLDRFRDRVGDWISVQRASLPKHQLRFASMVQSEGGGGAVVDPSKGGQVYGVLFEITQAQIEAMDREEFDPTRDVETTGKRVQMSVETDAGPLTAQLYTVDDDGGFLAPSESYLRHILRGLTAAGYRETAHSAVRAAAEEAARNSV